MDNMKMALIHMEEYKRLVRRDMELEQLEVVGVDNWSGWGQYDSITESDGEQEIEDAMKECETKLHITFPSGVVTGLGGSIELE